MMLTLDRRAHLSIFLAGALVAAGSALVMVSRWQNLSESSAPGPVPDPVAAGGTGWPAAHPETPSPAAPPSATAAPAAPPISAAPAAPAVPMAAPAPAPAPVPAVPAAAAKRNIRFTYRNSKPLKVDVVGSFNNWTPAAMTKGPNQTWEVVIGLAPGEYTYNFIVDGKPSRDPNNTRTAPEGRSLLVVRPLQ